MDEVSGPIIAIALVLCAVFVPTAFISGLTGQFYRQFALTIAISTVISAFNSLTLSPALASRLLRPRGAPRDVVQRAADRLFGWFFRCFNRFFARASAGYAHGVARAAARQRRGGPAVYGGLIGLTAVGFSTVPQGFVPTQDKDYLVAFAQLPDARDARSHRRGDPADVGHRAEASRRARARSRSRACRSTASSTRSNAGIAFVVLKPSEERHDPGARAPMPSSPR